MTHDEAMVLAEKLERGIFSNDGGIYVSSDLEPTRELMREAATLLRSLSLRLAEVEGERDEALEGKKSFADSYVEARTYGLKAVRAATELRAVLTTAETAFQYIPCPRPCNNRPDDFTAKACNDADECGCVFKDFAASVRSSQERQG